MNWPAIVLVGTILLLCLLAVLDCRRINKVRDSGPLTGRDNPPAYPDPHRGLGRSAKTPRPVSGSDERIARAVLYKRSGAVERS